MPKVRLHVDHILAPVYNLCFQKALVSHLTIIQITIRLLPLELASNHASFTLKHGCTVLKHLIDNTFDFLPIGSVSLSSIAFAMGVVLSLFIHYINSLLL